MDINMESISCESIVKVETPVDVPFHQSQLGDKLKSAECLQCEDTKHVGILSSSVCMNHLQLLSKGNSVPDIKTETLTEVLMPESECFVDKSELSTLEMSALNSNYAKVIRNTAELESQLSSSSMQPTIFDVQNLAETELEPIAQVFVLESEYYLEKGELCKEERTLLDNESANCIRTGSNVPIQSSLQCVEPSLSAIQRSTCNVETVFEIKQERMSEVLVTDGEYLLEKNEFCKEETTLLDYENAHFNRSISNVETHLSSSHMQPALLGRQRLVHEVGNADTMLNSVTDECVLKSEGSSLIEVESEPSEMTPLGNDCENVSALKSELNHDNIRRYCVRPLRMPFRFMEAGLHKFPDSALGTGDMVMLQLHLTTRKNTAVQFNSRLSGCGSLLHSLGCESIHNLLFEPQPSSLQFATLLTDLHGSLFSFYWAGFLQWSLQLIGK